MARISCRAHASTMATRSPCRRTVAVLIESQRWSCEKSRILCWFMKSGLDPARGQYNTHAVYREIGIAQQPGRVGQAENIRKMQRRARTFLAADHGEVILMAVQIGHEYDAGFVEARRRAKDMTRQRHRGRQDVVKSLAVAGCEAGQSRGSRRRN